MNTPLRSGNADPIASQPAASEIWRAYREIEIKYLPRVAMGLAIFYALLTLANVLFDDAAARLHLLLPTALMAVILIALALYTRRASLRPEHTLRLVVLVALSATVHALYASLVIADPYAALPLVLLIVALGGVLFSLRWYVSVLSVALIGWGVLVWWAGAAAQWLNATLAIGAAVILSVIIYALRNRVFVELETARWQQAQQRELLARSLRAMEETKAQLQSAETRYRTLVEQLPAVTFVDALDANVSTLYISPQVKALTGYSPEEWTADPTLWEKLLHPQDRARVLEAARMHNATGMPFDCEYRLIARDGHEVWVHDAAIIVRNEKGEALYSQGYITDITQRKAVEETLRRREAIMEAVSFAAASFLRVPHWEEHIAEVLRQLGQAAQASRVYIFENHRAPDGCWLTSQRYEWCTPGIAPQIDNPQLQNFPLQRDFGRWVEQLGAGKPVCGAIRDFPEGERAILADQGILSLAVMPIFVGGAWWGFIGFDACAQELEWSREKLEALQMAADTLGAAIHRERSEHALAAARDEAIKAARLKAEFLAMMSHEIRTPLSTIVGMSELLLETKVDAEQREYVQLVRHSAEVLLTIINDILDLSKIEADKMTLEWMEFDLPSLVRLTTKIVSMQAQQKGLALRLELASGLPQNVIGDAGRIRQVLLNLLSNAIKFTMQGEVVVRVRAVTDADKSEFFAGETAPILFSVSDTGIGLTEAARARLFQPFTQADMSITRRFGGTGLGLAISKRLVELMGGSIGVESTPECGSTFWFEIPLQVGPTLPDSSELNMLLPPSYAQDDAAARRLSARVLLVEDNASNQKLLQLQLQKLGIHKIEIANDGRAALAAVEKANREGTPFALVLMDCQMSEMDGLAATQAIRQLERSTKWRTPIVAMTAHGMGEDRDACFAAGMDGYVSKPVRLQALRRVLEQWQIVPKRSTTLSARAGLAERMPNQPLVLDPTTLEKMRALGTPDAAATVERLIQVFIEETGARLGELEEALAFEDAPRAQRVAHALKGSAASLGAQILARGAAEIEIAARNEAISGVGERLANLRDEFERVKAALKAELQRAEQPRKGN